MKTFIQPPDQTTNKHIKTEINKTVIITGTMSVNGHNFNNHTRIRGKGDQVNRVPNTVSTIRRKERLKSGNFKGESLAPIQFCKS